MMRSKLISYNQIGKPGIWGRIGYGLIRLAVVCLVGVLLGTVRGPAASAEEADRPMNILFLVSDDLNTDFGAYGGNAITPNIDKLMNKSVRFERAYVQSSTCIASRTSIFTGQRPATHGVYGWKSDLDFRSRFPDLVTMSELFMNSGYFVVEIGKVMDNRNDDPALWNVMSKDNFRIWEDYEKFPPTQNAQMIKKRKDRFGGKWFAYWAEVEANDDELGDGAMATEAIRFLEQFKKSPDQPFFLSVGFKSPHYDLVAPKKYFDWYRDIEIPGEDNSQWAVSDPEWDIGLDNVFGRWNANPQNALDALVGKYRPGALRAYYACISYMDAQVGRVLDALEENGFAENTIVIFMGDHGFHVGTRGVFGKNTVFEEVFRTPLSVYVPGNEGNGKVAHGLVEFIDIYPTLAEICGLKTPATVEGHSFVKLLKDPDRPGKAVVYGTLNDETEFLRTSHWKFGLSKNEATGFLYDLANDPEEVSNLYYDPTYQHVVKRLRPLLHEVKPKANVDGK